MKIDLTDKEIQCLRDILDLDQTLEALEERANDEVFESDGLTPSVDGVDIGGFTLNDFESLKNKVDNL